MIECLVVINELWNHIFSFTISHQPPVFARYKIFCLQFSFLHLVFNINYHHRHGWCYYFMQSIPCILYITLISPCRLCLLGIKICYNFLCPNICHNFVYITIAKGAKGHGHSIYRNEELTFYSSGLITLGDYFVVYEMTNIH